MTRMVMLSGATAALLLATVADVSAKPHDIRIGLTLEVVSAIHVPTGCVSSVEFDDGAFVQAHITDPLCLPHGVTKRFIPSSEQDFYALDPQTALIINR